LPSPCSWNIWKQ